jgi:hypothetical protein
MALGDSAKLHPVFTSLDFAAVFLLAEQDLRSYRMSELYPYAMGSLIIAFYDSQGYAGGILTHLHTGTNTAYLPNMHSYQ